jgi:flagellar hook assembly protein FlgD
MTLCEQMKNMNEKLQTLLSGPGPSQQVSDSNSIN